MAKDIAALEEKWQKNWYDSEQFAVDVRSLKDPFYILNMFPYPSGDKLHMGHWYQYGLIDTWARFQIMRGREVFQPMGFDAFGLPAENFAIKKGIHPDISTIKNTEHMITQMKRMGVAYPWNCMINTSKPEYYKWTQWIFLQFFKAGLAYRKEAPVNWCTGCHTVLANEQVVDGACERCGSGAVRKNLTQWFLKITDYADRLLDGIDPLDWPQKTKAMQKNWIGRSEGASINFALAGSDEKIEVFTTRPDTLFGVTYLTLAPEHPLALKIASPAQLGPLQDYIKETEKHTELERIAQDDQKTGVFTGAYALNPLSGEKVPIWVADYVLFSYGTGAVMAVPAHDERDFAFAKAHDLPINLVIDSPSQKLSLPLTEAYTDKGILINSGEFDGLSSDEAKKAITDKLSEKKCGAHKVTFRLRDWLVSRQRYWGTPIPIIHCPACGEVAVPEEDLPVVLPENVEFKPTGESPLVRCEEFINASCPKCGGKAKREADTLDTFVCSSWYFLRFPSAHAQNFAFEKELTEKFLPVDKYIGGPEHAILHLLYARFFTMFLHDQKLINFSEPFPSLIHQGIILAPDGQKMSKSKGNAISPDPYVEKYGSDILRLYLCFAFNYVDGGPWNDEGFIAVNRFMEKVERLFEEQSELFSGTTIPSMDNLSAEDKKLLFSAHNSIKGATIDTERFMFNTSIARLMEFYNAVTDYLRLVPAPAQNKNLLAQLLTDFIKILAPFAPHRAEEIWQGMGNETSIFKFSWPEWDEKYLVLDEINMAVMVNGKLRGEITVSRDAREDAIKEIASAHDKVVRQLEGMSIVKHIFVPGKLINFIVKPKS